jgi:hypothetical protein
MPDGLPNLDKLARDRAVVWQFGSPSGSARSSALFRPRPAFPRQALGQEHLKLGQEHLKQGLIWNVAPMSQNFEILYH